MNTAYERLKANLVLDHVRQYLESQSFNQYRGGLRANLGMYQNWVTGIDTALSIIDQAQAEVNKPEPVVTVIILDETDLRRIAFRVLVASIEDENVQALLPFQTAVELGSTFRHLRNESFYSVHTNSHIIEQGVTICARGGQPEGRVIDSVPTCPGCLIKAKNIIVKYLLEKCDGDYVRVAKMLADIQ